MKRMGLRALLPIALLLLTLVPSALPLVNSDIGPTQRTFYLTSSKFLLPSVPKPGLPTIANLTQTSQPRIEFDLSQFLFTQTATISGSMVFSLYLTSNVTLPGVSLVGSFLEKLAGQTGFYINVTSVQSHPIDSTRLQPLNFTYSIPSQTLGLGAHVSISMQLASPIPKGVGIKLYYDSSATPSFVTLPLFGYITLDQRSGPVAILDKHLNPVTSFNLNSTDLITIQTSVDSMLGFLDISRVNLTLVDPLLRPVRGETNLTMTPLPVLPSALPPYLYTTSWPYPSNATAGIYQVFIDIFDIQNNRAFSFRGPANFFQLSRTPNLFSPETLNLIPYAVGVTGAAALGVVYYGRRRRSKSYLVPFDYFNTLTNGELDGGSLVTVEGNTGSGKTILSEELMFEDLKKGRHCIFVATGDFPTNIREGMKSMGLDVSGYETNGLLTFVDGYSSEAGQESREKFFVPSLGDLTNLGMKISTSLQTDSFKEGSLFFDSLTPLASKTKPESLISFVQSVGAKVRGLGGKAFFTLGPSIEGTVQRRLQDMADCVVQMEAFEERGVRKSRMRISKLRARRFQQGWVIYTIEEGRGIIFYSKKPRK